MLYLKPGSKGKNKMECRWSYGTWLCSRDEAQGSIIGTESGCIKVRDVKSVGTHAEWWNHKEFSKFQGVPWEPALGQGGVVLKKLRSGYRIMKKKGRKFRQDSKEISQ